MNQFEVEKLFVKSNVCFQNKECFQDFENQNILKNLKISNEIKSFHPDRRDEYLHSRVCAYLLFKKNYQIELLDIPTNADRSPIWPLGFVGSITHNKDFVICGASNKLLGLGIDIESLGRVKKEFSKHILTSDDDLSCPDFDEIELMTIIFSAKESLYKALYPIVLKFFGFESAFVTKINKALGSFEITLKTQLTDDYGPASRATFEGKFCLDNNNCITVIEIDFLH